MTGLTDTLRPFTAIPGPPKRLISGNALDFRGFLLGPLIDAANNYGDISYFRFFWVNGLFVNHPDAIKHVLVDNQRNYKKSKNYDEMKLFLGEGLLTSSGEFWRRQRRLAQPAFHKKRLALLVDKMAAAGDELMQRWRGFVDEHEPVDMNEEMMRVTLQIVAATLFSYDINGADAAAVHAAVGVAQQFINERAQAMIPSPIWLPTRSNRDFRHARAALDALVYKIIGQRRAQREQHDDLLAMLLETCDEDTGESMTDLQVRDEVMTLVLAGHETTANALTWGWYLLARHPEVEHRLREEVLAVLGSRAPRFEDLPKLAYTSQVAQEILRLYPPAWIMERVALADDEIFGYRIPKNAFIMISPYTLHRNRKFWPEPERFDPDRFAPGQDHTRHKHAYLPFGAGPRVCIGSQFAMMELQLLLAIMVREFGADMARSGEVKPLTHITLRPEGGMPMHLRRAS